MKILNILLSYPPYRYIGAEIYDHTLNKALHKKGHTVYVKTIDEINNNQPYQHENILINHPIPTDIDLIITHIDLRQKAYHLKRLHNLNNTPMVGIQHNLGRETQTAERLYKWDGIIYNSQHMANISRNPTAPKTVLIPPTPNPSRKPISEGKAITQINLTALKGAKDFWQLVENNPHQQFIAVKGGWGAQIIPTNIPDNVKIYEHQNNLTPIWKKTGALLFLSAPLEAWGMVASEANAHGIPVIHYTPRPGIEENVGTLGGYPISGSINTLNLTSIPTPSTHIQQQAVENYKKHKEQLKDTVEWVENIRKY